MHSPTHRLLDKVARGVIKHPGSVLGVAALITAISIFIIVTRFDIRSDIKDLMPEHSKSVSDITKITERIGSIIRLTIVLEAPDAKLADSAKNSDAYKACLERASARRDPAKERCEDALVIFAHAVAKELESIDSVGYVQFHNDKRFFMDNLLLYASTQELEQLYSDIDAELTEARRISGEYKACLAISSDPADCKELEPGAVRAGSEETANASGGSAGRDYEEEFQRKLDESGLDFDSDYDDAVLPDGSVALKLQVHFRDASTSLKESQAHIDEIERRIQALDPESFNPGLKYAFTGGFKSQSEEYQSIINDVILSSGTTFGAIFLLMVVFFRRLRAVLVIMTPLLMAVLTTLGIAFATVGYLNLITAFIFAVLIGLGIDFGIHILARYDEERTSGIDAESALRNAVVHVGAPNISGALTTIACFFTLMLADFRGFSQFGLVGGIGVLLSLISIIVLMPAFIIIFQRLWPAKVRAVHFGAMPSSSGRLLWNLAAILVISGVISLTAYSATHYQDVQFEENFYRLKLKVEESKSEDRYKTMEKRHSSPAIVLLDSLEDVATTERITQRRADPQVVRQHVTFARRFPNFAQRLDEHFGLSFSLTREHSVAPVATALIRMLGSSFLSRNIPYYHEYDFDASRQVRAINAFTHQYPNFARTLSVEILPGTLAQHPAFGLMHVSSLLQSSLPTQWHRLLPSRFQSQRLHTISESASIYRYIPGSPEEQAAKLEIIQRIQDRTADRKIRFLPTEQKEKIQDLRAYLEVAPFGVDELPLWVKMQFREAGPKPAPPREGSGVDFAFGNAMFLYQNTASMDGEQARRFTEEMHTLQIDGETLTISANAIVFAEILIQIVKDGVMLTSFVLATVFIVVLIQNRSFWRALLIVSPLASAASLLIGSMVLLDVRITFYNIVIIPMLLGIGIDNGIHFYHRYLAEGKGSLFFVLRHSGGAIFMTSSTTAVGFSGMIMSMHQGLNTLGVLAVLGISVAWFSTMTVLPSLILLAEWSKFRWLLPKHDFDPASQNAPTPPVSA
ncbi:MAG: MMPL family transporter [Myxococcota bacterium]|jgi:predicted RND superfamily exporter protein|nr:MMPL family transporter [Myxococcota bacterium]